MKQFIDAMKGVLLEKHFMAYIHPIVPVLDETRGMVRLYNKIFEAAVNDTTDLQ